MNMKWLNNILNPKIDYWKTDDIRRKGFASMDGMKIEFVHNKENNTLDLIASDNDYKVCKSIKFEHWQEPIREVIMAIGWKRLINQKENKNIPDPPVIQKLNCKEQQKDK